MKRVFFCGVLLLRAERRGCPPFYFSRALPDSPPPPLSPPPLAPDGGFFGDGIEKFCPCPTLPVRGQMKITPFSNQHHVLTIVCRTKVSKCVYYSYQL